MNIVKVEDIQKKLNTVKELEELLLESWGNLLQGVHRHEAIKLKVLERIDFLFFYSLQNAVDYSEEIAILQKTLDAMNESTKQYSYMIQEKEKSIKALSELKKANGISENNTIQPVLVDWSV